MLNKWDAAGWTQVSQSGVAASMFCIPKKDGATARYVVDLRERNSNTIKDQTPIPDQDLILTQATRAKYRSKFDCTDAYFQI